LIDRYAYTGRPGSITSHTSRLQSTVGSLLSDQHPRRKATVIDSDTSPTADSPTKTPHPRDPSGKWKEDETFSTAHFYSRLHVLKLRTCRNASPKRRIFSVLLFREPTSTAARCRTKKVRHLRSRSGVWVEKRDGCVEIGKCCAFVRKERKRCRWRMARMVISDEWFRSYTFY
jgi:hypothetical protein